MMVYAEKTPGPDDGPHLTQVSLELDGEAIEILEDLMQRTGLNTSELMTSALGAYWREIEGIVLPQHEHEDMNKVLDESEADIRAGRTSSNQDVFARISAKQGW